MNKIKIIDLPEIQTPEVNTYIPVSAGVTNITKRIKTDNLVKIYNDLDKEEAGFALDARQGKTLDEKKADKNNPTFTGSATITHNTDPSDPNGESVFEIKNIFENNDVTDFKISDNGYVYVGKGMYFNEDTEIQSPKFTGASVFEGTVVVPTATEPTHAVNLAQAEALSGSLNGTNYLMVYGTGTPEENAAELQAAYDTAKSMPRYLGIIGGIEPFTGYIGQTFQDCDINLYHIITKDIANETYDTSLDSGNCSETTGSIAKSTRTTIIVAPGKYEFATPFTLNASGIDVVSLTGNADVFLNGIWVGADYIYIKGLNLTENSDAEPNLANNIYENCIFTRFDVDGDLEGKFIYCKSNTSAFTSTDNLNAEFYYCNARDNSFLPDGGSNTSKFYYCTGGVGSGIAGGAVVVDCVVNNIPISKDKEFIGDVDMSLANSVSIPSSNTLGISPTKPVSEAAVASAIRKQNIRIISTPSIEPINLNVTDELVIVSLPAGSDNLLRLPNVSNGIRIKIKIIGQVSMGLSANEDSSDTLDGVDINTVPLTLNQYDSITVVGTSTAWYILDKYTAV